MPTGFRQRRCGRGQFLRLRQRRRLGRILTAARSSASKTVKSCQNWSVACPR
ncbi:hypothetical protein EY643_07340 [Halioglobus maricola]|uniref:Uncharacterized protein n=1 Tax=Halioglobus maricola TaxID=2601894 RepID=A0A5P9NPP7_9GAMM|nr:hypothetical protein EY643_07340 [Halioglobus maricola]